jgi:hypothetical protein
MEYIPAVSLQQLRTNVTFVATVISKRLETSHGVRVGGASAAAMGTSATFTNLVVTLSRQDGSQVAILETAPDSNALAFAAFLQQGVTYEFPRTFQEWQTHKSLLRIDSARQQPRP